MNSIQILDCTLRDGGYVNNRKVSSGENFAKGANAYRRNPGVL
jgi:hypothetical protein